MLCLRTTTRVKQIFIFGLIFSLIFSPAMVTAEEVEVEELNLESDLENEIDDSVVLENLEDETDENLEKAWSRLEKLGRESNQGDFVIGPGKFEISVAPGQTVTKEISVTNRISDGRTFEITVEDIQGSNDGDKAVVLLGKEDGPYTIKDYLKFKSKRFTLDLGERAWIPVTIEVPADAEPGGHYGSVLISTVQESEEESSSARTPIIAKIGTLFFITVEGDVEKSGNLKSFETKNNEKWFTKGPINFHVLYENTGSVHLNPYGELRVKNLFGDEVGFLEVDPWFALPKSLRSRDIAWDRNLLFGRYTATLSINRGYDDIVDELKIVFWVFPWKMVGGIFIGIFTIILLLRFIFKNFEFKRKT